MIAAVVQLCSGAEVARNLERAEHWIAEAAASGAKLVVLPENFAYLAEPGTQAEAPSQTLEGPIVAFLQAQARRHGLWLGGGTFPEAIPGDRRHYNTALLLDPSGQIQARYRKIHLFDVALADARHCESATVAPGNEAVSADTPFGRIGLSVCYDVRFPELYRALAAQGARLLLVPSAFTVPTGRDHWEVLLRARAIENQAFVLAPAQHGVHGPTRRSFGRSLIVDPWGVVLANAADGEGLALARLDFERLEKIRRELPALEHRRL